MLRRPSAALLRARFLAYQIGMSRRCARGALHLAVLAAQIFLIAIVAWMLAAAQLQVYKSMIRHSGSRQSFPNSIGSAGL